MLATVNCGNNCNVVAKLVQEYHMFLTHFTSVLRKQFAVNDTFLREANIYKRALALRNSRLVRPVVHTSSKYEPLGTGVSPRDMRTGPTSKYGTLVSMSP